MTSHTRPEAVENPVFEIIRRIVKLGEIEPISPYGYRGDVFALDANEIEARIVAAVRRDQDRPIAADLGDTSSLGKMFDRARAWDEDDDELSISDADLDRNVREGMTAPLMIAFALIEEHIRQTSAGAGQSEPLLDLFGAYAVNRDAIDNQALDWLSSKETDPKLERARRKVLRDLRDGVPLAAMRTLAGPITPP